MITPNTGQRMSTVDVRDKIVQIVRSRGPLLPIQITKDLGVNVIMASAMLSELVDRKILRLSHTKVGGSPVYFVIGQEAKLQALRDKLNDKEQHAFDMLKQQKVLRDTEQPPVIRIALRNIKDFAHQLQVHFGSTAEIFWKWYLVTDAEAEHYIKEKLGVDRKQPHYEEVEKNITELEQDLKKLEEKKPKPIEQVVREQIEPVKKPEPQKTKQETLKKEELRQPKPVVAEADKFMSKVLEYFTQNKIEASDIKLIRKNNDFECTIKIPSVVGSIAHFCKAKNKQKVTDADLSLLYVQSQIRKMPVLFVTTGEMTKKAQDLLKTEFKNITVKKL